MSTTIPPKRADLKISLPALAPIGPLSQTPKQIGNNYHSSSLSMLMPYTVNKTSLHPGGVLPQREHTEIEEELQKTARINYDRVEIIANPSVAVLYEDALVYETGSAITSTGALTAYSGAKTGRSPLDKRIVREPSSENEIWWGPVNRPMTPAVWKINKERAVDYLNTRNRIYVVDGYAGWDDRYRINVRVVCARAYHALFMRNMLIRPSREELEHFHPDYSIYNAGSFPANRYTTGMTSATSVAINFAEKEMVILGTEYAGEMKKGVFTILFYEMPVKHNILTLHSSANEGKDGDVTVFFGLSGTGKTTLSADPHRALIGDDEHCWSDRGIFNIEGGCYAKTVGLSAEKEPDIYNAIKFGSILENVVFSPETRVVDYNDSTLTENTRCAYPIEYIANAKIPCVSTNHPSNIILLTCDARGVLPPISKLTSEQTMFHFISGYTSKMAGTEDGVTEPQATFSSCFAQPFLALHPMRYAKMLAEKISQHKANAWLLNTGWVGAGASTGGKRCPLKYTRAILDAIHSGELAEADYETYETFNLHIPTTCSGVPSELLNPKKSWNGKADFKEEVIKLGRLFVENFKKYEDEATSEVIKAGPELEPNEVAAEKPQEVKAATNKAAVEELDKKQGPYGDMQAPAEADEGHKNDIMQKPSEELEDAVKASGSFKTEPEPEHRTASDNTSTMRSTEPVADIDAVVDANHADGANHVGEANPPDESNLVGESNPAADSHPVAESNPAAESHSVAESNLAADSHSVGGSNPVAKSNSVADPHVVPNGYPPSLAETSPTANLKLFAGKV